MGKRGKRSRRQAAARRRDVERVVAAGEQEPGQRDAGFAFHARRALSWVVDYVLSAGLVSVFYFCAGVFYHDASVAQTTLEPATEVPAIGVIGAGGKWPAEATGHLMLVCAIITLLLLTVVIPLERGGQTIGERLFGVRVENRDGAKRTIGQCLVRECALKVVFGPFTAVFCLADYVILGLIMNRDAEHELLIDRACKTRVVPSRVR